MENYEHTSTISGLLSLLFAVFSASTASLMRVRSGGAGSSRILL